MSSFLEQRTVPLGTTFLQQKEELFSSPEPAALRRSWALRKFGPSRLRRHHSIGGFIPFGLAELPPPKAGQGFPDKLCSSFPASALVKRDKASEDLLAARVLSDDEASQASEDIALWPDTDSDREEVGTAGSLGGCRATYPRHVKAASYGASSGSLEAQQRSKSRFGLQSFAQETVDSSNANLQPAGMGCLMQQPQASQQPSQQLQQQQLQQLQQPPQHLQTPQQPQQLAPPVLQLNLAAAVSCSPHSRVSTTTPSWPSISLCSATSPWTAPAVDPAAVAQGSPLAASPMGWATLQLGLHCQALTQAQHAASSRTTSDGTFSDAQAGGASTRRSAGSSDPGEQEAITTLMIRNLPTSITQSLLLEELDRSGFGDLYDFAYMPMSFDAKTGKGYAFVNFNSQATAGMFVGAWHETRRCGVRGAPLNISPAAIQGVEANIRKWAGPRMARIRNPALRPFIRGTSEAAPAPKGGLPRSGTGGRQAAPAGPVVRSATEAQL